MAPKTDTLFQAQIADSGFTSSQEIFLMKMHSDGIARMEKAVTLKMDERFTAYGFDTRAPIEIQKDMAFVNKLRKVVDSMVMRGIATILACGAIIGLGIRFFKDTKN